MFAPEHAICDRPDRVEVKNGRAYKDPEIITTSLLNRPSAQDLKEALDSDRIKMAVVWSEENKRKLSEIFREIYSTEKYTVFLSPSKVEFKKHINRLLEDNRLYEDR